MPVGPEEPRFGKRAKSPQNDGEWSAEYSQQDDAALQRLEKAMTKLDHLVLAAGADRYAIHSQPLSRGADCLFSDSQRFMVVADGYALGGQPLLRTVDDSVLHHQPSVVKVDAWVRKSQPFQATVDRAALPDQPPLPVVDCSGTHTKRPRQASALDSSNAACMC